MRLDLTPENVLEIKNNSYEILAQLKRLNANIKVLNDNIVQFYKMVKKEK